MASRACFCTAALTASASCCEMLLSCFICIRLSLCRVGSAHPTLTISKSFKLGKFQLAAVHVHAPELGAARRFGHGLARIEQALGIECGFQCVELDEFFLGELHAHL